MGYLLFPLNIFLVITYCLKTLFYDFETTLNVVEHAILLQTPQVPLFTPLSVSYELFCFVSYITPLLQYSSIVFYL